jgi:hypothetical protein
MLFREMAAVGVACPGVGAGDSPRLESRNASGLYAITCGRARNEGTALCDEEADEARVDALHETALTMWPGSASTCNTTRDADTGSPPAAPERLRLRTYEAADGRAPLWLPEYTGTPAALVVRDCGVMYDCARGLRAPKVKPNAGCAALGGSGSAMTELRRLAAAAAPVGSCGSAPSSTSSGVMMLLKACGGWGREGGGEGGGEYVRAGCRAPEVLLICDARAATLARLGVGRARLAHEVSEH